MRQGPRITQTSESKEKQDDVRLTPELFKDIIFWSFYYSQGEPDLQHYMFRYAALKHSDWEMPQGFDTTENSEYKDLLERTKAFFERTTAHKSLQLQGEEGSDELVSLEKKINPQINTEVKYFRSCLESRDSLFRKKSYEDIDGLDERDVLLKIFTALVTRDNRYNTTHHRPTTLESKNKSGMRPAKGPFRRDIIHVCEYVLASKPGPGPEVFSELFEDLRTMLQDPSVALDDETKRGVGDLIKSYNRSTLDVPITLSDYPALARNQ